ncbi:transketolase C-terminal domain-containing protein [Treponema sp. HNW]|uniref:transketolase family protein n=1 Tax=Treponema sp. HNW TaxID=3116654 RepID=UPI003D0EB6C6
MNIVYNGEKDRAFKDVLSQLIPHLAAQDTDVIYLDADLMNTIGTAKWAKEHPERAVNCGIAEANMAGVASGLSAAGFKPIMHTFGPFASRRCFDQIFLSGGYAGNSVTVIGTDPGVCATFNGGTHMPFEDVALYRAIPNSMVFDITDTAMLESVLEQCKDIHGIKYLRVGRKTSPKVYADSQKFELGKGIVLRDGKDITLVACGIMTAKALEAAEVLAKEGISAAVIDMFTIKPLDEDLLVSYAKKTGAVVTAENHNKIGGLYSACTDAMAKHRPFPIEYVAVEDTFGEVGPQDYLEERFGLTVSHIVEKARTAVKRKNREY